MRGKKSGPNKLNDMKISLFREIVNVLDQGTNSSHSKCNSIPINARENLISQVQCLPLLFLILIFLYCRHTFPFRDNKQKYRRKEGRKEGGKGG
jgi:hypothetical protein